MNLIPQLDVSGLGSPILIVSPHPDDDILAAGGLIQIAQHLGKTVYVVCITNGDANGASVRDFLRRPLDPSSYIQLGMVRHDEAVRATASLGVPASHLFFLGFPDGATYEIATDKTFDRVHQSPYTRLTRADYPFSYRFDALYSHQSALSLMASVLTLTHPGTVIVNLSIDIHSDHKAARILTDEAIKNVGIHPTVYSYLIHYVNWPNPTGPLRPPKVNIPGVRTLKLTSNQVENKRRAYTIERSQSSLSDNNYNLIRQNELFWRNG